MSIKEVLLRFFFLYIILAIVVGIAMQYFGIKSNSAVNIVILAACVFWTCMEFGKKNQRYFSRREVIAVVFGFVAIDISLQALVAAAALLQPSPRLDIGTLVFAIGFIGALHGIAIYLFVRMAKTLLIKRGVLSA